MPDQSTPVLTIPAGADGIDFAWWRPGDSVRPWSFVVRYICKLPNGKAVTAAEIAFYHSLGVAVLLVWEQGSSDWQQGAAKGTEQGKLAMAFAASLGYPKGLAILAAFDTNAVAGDARALAYGTAFADEVEAGGWSLGLYSDLDVMRLLQGRSTINWLAGARAWSAPGPLYRPEDQPGYELVHVRQTISGSTPNYDRNIVLRPFWAWMPHTEAYPVLEHQPTTPSPQEADMPAIVTNADAYTDPGGQTHGAGQTKWEYVGGEKVHISFEYWNGLGAPQGTPRPYAEISAVLDHQGATVVAVPAPASSFTVTSTVTAS